MPEAGPPLDHGRVCRLAVKTMSEFMRQLPQATLSFRCWRGLQPESPEGW